MQVVRGDAFHGMKVMWMYTFKSIPMPATSSSPASKKGSVVQSSMAASFSGLSSVALIATAVMTVAQIVFYILTISWIVRISRNSADCKCSKNWRKTYIAVFPLLSVLFGVLITALGSGLYPLVSLLLIAGWGFFIYVALSYVRLLKESNCVCATKGTGDDVLQVYAFFPVVAWSTIIIILIITALILKMKK